MQNNASPVDNDYERILNTYWSFAQAKFYASDRCHDAREMLQEIIDSPDYETRTNNFENELNFKDRHLDYLSKHPRIDLAGYMSNLKLMTRKRKVYKG